MGVLGYSLWRNWNLCNVKTGHPARGGNYFAYLSFSTFKNDHYMLDWHTGASQENLS